MPTWRNTTFWTTAGWRWWRTASLCGTVPSWRLTRHWCRLCTGMAQHVARRPHTTELPSNSTPAGGNPPRVRSSGEKEDKHSWWCWRQKWADGSQKRQHPSFTPLPRRSPAVSLRSCEAASGKPSLAGGKASSRALRRSLSLCRCWTSDQRATRGWTRRQCTRLCGIAGFCEVTGHRAPVVVSVERFCCH